MYERKKERKKEIKKMNENFSFHHSIYNIKKNDKSRYSIIRTVESSNHALYLLSIQRTVYD
jgi:hypothetical protein